MLKQLIRISKNIAPSTTRQHSQQKAMENFTSTGKKILGAALNYR